MEENTVWHPEVLSLETERMLAVLSGHRALKEFYLAGGTAPALQYGHRKSIDLDLFSANVVNEDVLLGMLQEIQGIALVSKSPETLHLHAGPTKVSFLGCHYRVR